MGATNRAEADEKRRKNRIHKSDPPQSDDGGLPYSRAQLIEMNTKFMVAMLKMIADASMITTGSERAPAEANTKLMAAAFKVLASPHPNRRWAWQQPMK